MERKNRTKFAMLGILSIGPHSGYDIKKFCEQVLSYFWQESYGQIYPLLRHLEAEKLIRKDRRSRTKSERRIAYVLTALGRRELDSWLKQPFAMQAPRNELLLKIFFSNLVGPEIAVAQIDAYETAQRALLETLNEALNSLDGEAENEEGIYWKLTVDLGLRLCAARIDWCQVSRRELKRIGNR